MTASEQNGGAGRGTLLGHPIAHVGYGVTSNERTVDYLVKNFGAGPFFLMEDINIDELKNADGDPIVWEHSAVFGWWGGVAVELQEVKNLEPSDAFGPAYEQKDIFNHIALAVDDIAGENERMKRLGFDLLFEAVNGPDTSSLFHAPLLGHTIELHEVWPEFEAFHELLRTEAEGWDGSDPIRPVSDEIYERLVKAGS
jgi:methylmalonyl-CoA/ethylmalonyl-CoA epimerase